MVMGIGRGGDGPSEVTCRIGGDRPGCDFMVTTLGKWRADTGTSTGRLMLAVLGGPMWSATLSAPAPPKAGTAPRPKGGVWADPCSHTRATEGGHSTARAALRCKNWRRATT